MVANNSQEGGKANGWKERKAREKTKEWRCIETDDHTRTLNRQNKKDRQTKGDAQMEGQRERNQRKGRDGGLDR